MARGRDQPQLRDRPDRFPRDPRDALNVSVINPHGILAGVEEYQGLAVIECPDAAAWEAWLAEHHERSTGVWLRLAKKGSGVPSVTANEALDVVLCYGWIDGLRHSQDETYFLQRYTHRRPRSAWSLVNVTKVDALITSGRMRPSGLAEVEAAKADGRWAAAYGVRLRTRT